MIREFKLLLYIFRSSIRDTGDCQGPTYVTQVASEVINHVAKRQGIYKNHFFHTHTHTDTKKGENTHKYITHYQDRFTG